VEFLIKGEPAGGRCLEVRRATKVRFWGEDLPTMPATLPREGIGEARWKPQYCSPLPAVGLGAGPFWYIVIAAIAKSHSRRFTLVTKIVRIPITVINQPILLHIGAGVRRCVQ
jgi:hypothetical protein